MQSMLCLRVAETTPDVAVDDYLRDYVYHAAMNIYHHILESFAKHMETQTESDCLEMDFVNMFSGITKPVEMANIMSLVLARLIDSQFRLKPGSHVLGINADEQVAIVDGEFRLSVHETKFQLWRHCLHQNAKGIFMIDYTAASDRNHFEPRVVQVATTITTSAAKRKGRCAVM
jgi:hypothetical protein